ncbi:MAG: 16S rRNA (adenine1518-N6/adenine1519-N6)-dimethyltransferase [Rickettsiales bacterium]|jgi:16S rRNA (adenine1518-N6/adenine1519-N6)-dimethyltransferase
MIPTTSETIKKYGLDAKKSLGQNFILDANLTDKIARKALEKEESLEGLEILEIGGGPGGLTKSILKLNPKKLTVIEQDDRCIAALEEIQTFYPDQLEIIKGDALKFDIASFCAGRENAPLGSALDKSNPTANPLNRGKVRIIANLPYNIATELLFKWLLHLDNIELMVLMFQKEVVERIVAKPSTRAFGRLAVMVNFFCVTKKLFDISASSFTPSPKVTSSLILIKPRPKPIMEVDFKKLEKVVAAAFSQRRKMIKAGLRSVTPNSEEWLEKSGIAPSMRAEQLTLEQFGNLVLNLPTQE